MGEGKKQLIYDELSFTPVGGKTVIQHCIRDHTLAGQALLQVINSI